MTPKDHLTFFFENCDLPEFLPIAADFGTREYGYVATPNVDGLIRLHESESFRAQYAQATYVLLDSRVAAFLFRLVHRVQVPVCPGSDLTAALFQQVIKTEDRVIVIGSTTEQVQALRERFGLEHLVHHNPPMGFINDPAAVEACLQFVESASPFRFCLVAVGDPQGVIISHKLIERGKARGLAFVVGASIDFMTGRQRRAPAWMQHAGLEWLHRLLSNPRRLARRYLLRCPRFFLHVFRSRIELRQPAYGGQLMSSPQPR
jgi:exopolysaccharide biosynthesis WecB/TagA/CpsF family protein